MLTSMFNFDADHVPRFVEVKNYVFGNLLRVGAGGVLELDVKRVRVRKVIESHV
jgi:hypothetical protein